MLKVGFIKILADGSLGARTAALNKAYSDDHKTRGLMLYTRKKLNQMIMKAHSAGLQLGVHAIGDRAVENVLDAYRKALRKVPRRNHRHRIEHCAILNPKLIDDMKRLGLVASVQPHFVISDFWTTDRVGSERARSAYPFRTLLKKGVVVASGSDCPVEQISPILGIWAAVTRKDKAEEVLAVEEALKTYTVNAAYASFDEKKKGTIEPGKLADLTILSDDPMGVPADKIRNLAVEMVIVDGKVVYSKE
jgi:predicted amidohydrolase YtcJ